MNYHRFLPLLILPPNPKCSNQFPKRLRARAGFLVTAVLEVEHSWLLLSTPVPDRDSSLVLSPDPHATL